MSTTLELKCKRILYAKGVNSTPTRIEILKLFLRKKKALTMAEIHEHLQTIIKSVNLSTVSENLLIMRGYGIILAKKNSHQTRLRKSGRPAVKYLLAIELTERMLHFLGHCFSYHVD